MEKERFFYIKMKKLLLFCFQNRKRKHGGKKIHKKTPFGAIAPKGVWFCAISAGS
jgi:hypothetical protein